MNVINRFSKKKYKLTKNFFIELWFLFFFHRINVEKKVFFIVFFLIINAGFFSFSRNNIDKQALAELQSQCQEYRTLYQVAQVERDKFSELVRVLQSRYTYCLTNSKNSNHELVHFLIFSLNSLFIKIVKHVVHAYWM